MKASPKEHVAAMRRPNLIKQFLRLTARLSRTRRGRLIIGVVALFLLLLLTGVMRYLSLINLETHSPTLLFEDVRGRFLAELGNDEKRMGYWPLPRPVPTRVEKATLAAEDARFYTYPGVDPSAVVRALVQNLSAHRRVSGASTIAMQVARLSHPAPRTWLNKVREALVAIGLVLRYGHEAVLRQYLTIAPYGNRNRGIVYAARRYFDKPVEDLSWAQAALLASLPKLPGRMNIHRAGGWFMALRRTRYVLGRLRKLGWINEADYKEALRQLARMRLAPRKIRPISCLHAILAVQQELAAHPELRPAGGRHIVPTTLDLDLQREVSWLAWKAYQRYYSRGAGNVALIVAERKSGKILAYVGSADYFDAMAKGAIDYARIPRSPGSTLKPFIYGLGLTLGRYTAASLLTDVGLAMDPWSGTYVVKNYDGRYLGPVLYENALANSRNIPAVEVLHAVGIENAYRHFYDLGLVQTWKDPSSYGLGMALGALHVTLMDLVGAYGVLANDGLAYHLRWFPSSPSHSRGRSRLIPEDTARMITLVLSNPVARLPSFQRGDALEFPFPVAVKTGTSQGFRDAWCIGYSRKYIVGVWIGNADAYPMDGLSGADSAAVLFHQVLAYLQPDAMQGLENNPFPPPRDYVAKRINMLTGKLAAPDSPYVSVQWFQPGTEPHETTHAYRNVVFDSRTGRPALPGCPRRFREKRRFFILPPRFATWAKASGLGLLPVTNAPETADMLLKQNPHLAVTSPHNGAVLLPDPEAPANSSSIALLASVKPPTPQIIWYVDGKPFKVVDYPYTTRWSLKAGHHVFQVSLPYAPLHSPPVAITVREVSVFSH